MPKVSVLVPIYNVEKYLRECLDSLINQTLDNIEIILINDSSTDSSLQIIQEYRFKDKRIKVINKSNTGYGHSMNVGLDVAKGKYIGIVEPDDFVNEKMFEDLYDIITKFDSDIVKSEHYEYSTNNNLQARKTGTFVSYKTNTPITAKQYPALIKMQPTIWSCLYKKEFLNNNNIKFLETKGASFQDTSFFFKTMCLAKSIVLTSKAYYYYRQDNINSSVKAKDKIYSICDEYDEIDNFLNANPEIKKFINSQKLIKQYGSYIWNLTRLDDGFFDEFIDKFIETFKSYYKNNEITEDFYKKIGRKEFKSLINSKDKFKKHMSNKINREKNRANRRKFFSIHINASRISIVLFGKQILEVG